MFSRRRVGVSRRGARSRSSWSRHGLKTPWGSSGPRSSRARNRAISLMPGGRLPALLFLRYRLVGRALVVVARDGDRRALVGRLRGALGVLRSFLRRARTLALRLRDQLGARLVLAARGLVKGEHRERRIDRPQAHGQRALAHQRPRLGAD